MDILAIAALVLSTAGALLLVPDIHLGDLIEPTVHAAVGTPLVLTAILIARHAGWRPVIERRLLATFLFLMPTVYLLSLALHGVTRPWLMVEIAGQILFAAIALAGLRFSGWILVAGLAGHGLLWDLWHLGRNAFIPDWYGMACLMVDVGWAGYAASRVGVWNAERAAEGLRADRLYGVPALAPGR